MPVRRSIDPSRHLGGRQEAQAHCPLCGARALSADGRCASCLALLGRACATCKSLNPQAARFCISCGLKLLDRGADQLSSSAERATLERRHVTVVFCDLVGSASLATSMDAEDFTQTIGSILRCMTEIVEQFGGFLAQYLGDGTLSYFGYPSANEDDTERAVGAALAMVEAVSSVELRDGRRFAARAGISAGEVIVGDIVGIRSPRGLDMAGELPNLAARLQATAETGTVVMDDAVFRIAGEMFDCRSLGARELKGWDSAVPAWQVLGPAKASSRFDARDRSRLTTLIGRTSEAALLATLWGKARAGCGRAVLLVGDPGIGKSRLVADLLQQTVGEDHARLRYACSALQQGVPLAPFVRDIERAAGFTPDDGPETRRTKLRATLGGGAEQDLDLISDLLGLPVATRQAVSQLSPQKRRERTMATLISIVTRLSETRPVLAVFEDAHWSDPTSAEILGRAVRSIAARRVLLIVTARPEFDPPWARDANAEIIELDPLSAVESREMIGWVAGEGRLTREAVRDIAARSDGIPLFLEEITKAVIEASAAAASAMPHRPRGAPSVPSAIHSSLLARLDRLGNARDVAEVAAAIGRDFNLALLARVMGQPEAVLWPALARLMQAGLVLPCSPDRRQFRFKHALIQDAAYGIIVRTQRRALHARIVQALETHFPKLATAEPQLLAHHCTEAGFGEKAATWWLRAGVQSLMRSATQEALTQLARGLAAAEALPATRARDQQELDLRIVYAKALIATHGHAAPSTEETFAIARDLCERLGRPPQFLTVLYGQWTHALFRADLCSAQRQAEEILRSAEEQQDGIWKLVGCYCLGITNLPLGSFHRVCDHLRHGLATAVAPGRSASAGPLTADPVVVMRTYLCRALLCMGHLDEARRECLAAVEEARRLGQAFTLAFALFEEAYLTLMTVSFEAALPHLEELQQVAGEHGIAFFEAVAMLFRGWSRAMLGDHAGGLALMHEGRDMYVGASNLLYVPSYMRMEAEVLGLAGQPEEGLRLLAQAGRLKNETGALWDEAEFERTRAELLWASGRTDEAEDAFRHAIRLACGRSAKLFELRAAVAFASRLAGSGRPSEATRQLAPVCAWFEERGSCSELTQARLMAETLGPVAAAD